ncbi:MAG TPA: type II secretion system F family protein [Dehalococcoidia bacterium]|nr:type II secretion system F family protein [Dehalococcoidia bacterium]
MVLGIFGFFAVFIAVTSLLLWVLGLSEHPAEARLERIRAGRVSAGMEESFSRRAVQPLLKGLARFIIGLLPHSFVARIGRQLVTAGRPLTTQAFFTTVLLIATVPAALVLMLLMASGADAGIVFFGVMMSGTFGLFLPFLWLRRRVRERKFAIWKSLPDAFDLVTVCVEAGLGLDAALRQVSEKLPGPLSEEIRHTLREVGMGRARREALAEMAERLDVTELTTFVNSVIQAEQLGTSLGKVLRAQSFNIRVRRRQRAEEVARKAPVKMVFPLVFCIMPSFFIVILGPIVVRLAEYLNE